MVFTETSVLPIQPQNPLMPETQARFQAHSRTHSQHKSQPLSKSLPQTQHQAGLASKLPKEKKVTLDDEGDVVNTTLPTEARSIVLHTLNNMWRDWKHRLKCFRT
ncbi:hypothetical protein BUALT_Bualt18G0013100 [Buddleja alternifolia]|uniref:Uncharacterized protein n=1 Tax=Buddleja alternifolia TaxID=168488 RepID=A0AAV6WC82_9LAMI|nr:hypothetical protein BUALT_Bualt18G0013100 [Buddleja alternifolia]